jgi:hypothetical protein
MCKLWWAFRFISLANPLKKRDIAEARIKYDKLYASILADLAGADLISKCYVPDKYIREIRTLIRHRIDVACSMEIY